jgi:hypothetical protein
MDCGRAMRNHIFPFGAVERGARVVILSDVIVDSGALLKRV